MEQRTLGSTDLKTAPIVGPRTLAHLEDSLVALDDEARAACDELVAPGNAVADFHNSSRWTKPLRLPGGD